MTSRKSSQNDFQRRTEKYYERFVGEYDRLLIWVLRHQRFTMLVAVLTLVLTVVLYILIPKGFFPLQDTGFIQAITTAGPTVSFDEMSRRQQALAAKILQDKDVESLSSFIGVDGTNDTLNSGRYLINLKPKTDRDSVTQVVARLQQDASAVPGITFYLQPVQDLTIDSVVSRAEYQFVLQAATSSSLNDFVPKLLTQLGKAPALTNVSTDFLDKGLSAFLVVDRDTAARFGITSATIDNALYDAFGQRIISTIFTQSNQYRVILEADPKLQNSVASMNDIYVPSAGGGQVPLSAIAHVDQRTVPLQIDHMGQFPSATISFDVAPGYSLGEAVDAVNAAEIAAGHPSGVTTQFEGSALAFQSALGNELLLIIAAIVTVYIVLGVLYESFIHPLTILSTLPSAGVGALLFLILFGHGAQHRFHHRHHSADRHRQEERHHDDRLRAGGRAQRRQIPRGRHPPGGAAALPPHPDDHGGGDVWRHAADVRHRHGVGAAPSAGHFHRRRIAGEPASHPLHHACHLYLFRPLGLRAARMARPAPRPAARRLCPRSGRVTAAHG